MKEVAEGIVEKRLTPRQRSEPEAELALRREAFLLGALDGNGAPRLLSTGTDERGPYLRMERAPGRTLAEWLDTGRGLRSPTSLEPAIRAAFSALAVVHEAGDEHGPLSIVHGDLATGNIVIAETCDRAWILDFELATYRNEAHHDGAFRGTLAYAAPELARGLAPSVQSDLFALAATFLHVATGVPPRSAPSFPAALLLAAECPLPAERLDALTGNPALVQVRACLAHDPAARPASARAVAMACV